MINSFRLSERNDTMQGSATSTWQPSRRLERGNAAEQILEDLRSRILDGQLPRGSKLPTEKQLADGYGVSGPTVREAIRGLTTARLVEVRHGSGAYVTADADQLIEMSLSSMMQLERVGFPEVMGVLGTLIEYAAEVAAVKASQEDVDTMYEALREIDNGANADAIMTGVRNYIAGLAKASGNVLLAVLCRFLASVQIALIQELTGGSLDAWRKTARALAKYRLQVVDAIAARDADAAREAARVYGVRSVKNITSLSAALDTMLSDSAMASLLATMERRG
jgi:GntR family transcriptional regulator, transcriptional repressor for pyruvate dehydrogenase complex